MSDTTTATKTIQIEVLRYRPEQDSEPVWQSYTVPYTDDRSVLQGLQQIKDDQDGTMSFSGACRLAPTARTPGGGAGCSAESASPCGAHRPSFAVAAAAHPGRRARTRSISAAGTGTNASAARKSSAA